jgi:hypothetical protein
MYVRLSPQITFTDESSLPEIGQQICFVPGDNAVPWWRLASVKCRDSMILHKSGCYKICQNHAFCYKKTAWPGLRKFCFYLSGLINLYDKFGDGQRKGAVFNSSGLAGHAEFIKSVK